MPMELSIVHNIALAKALNEIKSLNFYTACVRNNILRIIESCFFRWIPGKNGGFCVSVKSTLVKELRDTN